MSSLPASTRGRRPRPASWVMWLAAITLLVPVTELRTPAQPDPIGAAEITGPMQFLLTASTDLGPARGDRVQLTAALRGTDRPVALIDWAETRQLAADWRAGDSWVILSGAPAAVSRAFDLDVHDYRGRRGQEFYASPQQPQVPPELRAEVGELGRILGYTPHHTSTPSILPLDVPNRALTPASIMAAYNIEPLARRGYSGKNGTVVIFAFDGFAQSDMDQFSEMFELPKFVPEVVGGQPGPPGAELTMDLQIVHAIAPAARKVVVNALPTVQGDGGYPKIAAMMEDADRRYPGAVWSLSIGWGCDKLPTAADLEPIRAALRRAQSHGTVAFNASGDLAGLECKGGDDWSAPPSPADIGLDSVASLPEMTSVGGTTLSTDADAKWLAEQSWFDVPLSQGTGGGVSALFDMPPWQRTAAAGIDPQRSNGKRLTPDIAAVADPFTGMTVVFGGQTFAGGGTSQSAPIWAGLAAVMNDFLTANGGERIGEFNPLLYRIAQGAQLPAFQDVTLGGNAVDDAAPGYDLTTGLGTPDVDNLARDILILQRSGL